MSSSVDEKVEASFSWVTSLAISSGWHVLQVAVPRNVLHSKSTLQTCFPYHLGLRMHSAWNIQIHVQLAQILVKIWNGVCIFLSILLSQNQIQSQVVKWVVTILRESELNFWAFSVEQEIFVTGFYLPILSLPGVATCNTRFVNDVCFSTFHILKYNECRLNTTNHTYKAFWRKMEKNTTLHNFVLFLWRRHFKNSCFGFHQVSKREKTFETTRPQASWFQINPSPIPRGYPYMFDFRADQANKKGVSSG